MSLDLLKPSIRVVELLDPQGNKLGDFRLMTLSYTEYNNVVIGLEPPARRAKLVPGGIEEDITNTAEYQAERATYDETLVLRRIAKALDGGGDFAELRGLSLDEQVELLRDIDAGVIIALNQFLQREAGRKSVATFQPVHGNGTHHSGAQKLDAGAVVITESD